MQSIAELRRKLEEVAGNLWWSWNEEAISLFRALDPDLWLRAEHNPILLLRGLSDAQLEDRIRRMGLTSRILSVRRRMAEYLESRETWGSHRAGMLAVHPVAYFCMEFGLNESLPLYSGGLGVLAGDHLKSASDLGVPLVGVGIFYAQGYFRQRLDGDYWQQEEFGTYDQEAMPLETLRGADGAPLRITIPAGGNEVVAHVRQVLVGRCRLLLLDTDVEGNEPGYRELTHRLYWGDETSRIRQEIVLGVGGVRTLAALGIRPGVIHMNEGHSAFALLEAIRRCMELNGVSFDEAAHRVGLRSVFTTHTPVPAGHDRFPPDLVLGHLGWLRDALGLDDETFLGLGRVRGDDPEETFCMTVLALKLSRRANGVSSIHGDVSRRMWQALWPGHRSTEVPIGHVTNGVHTSSWIAPQFTQFLEAHLGKDWRDHLTRETLWRRVKRVRDDEVWEVHSVLKGQLLDFIRQRFAEQEARRGADPRVIAERMPRLFDPEALTIGFARRFATYKRSTLLFEDMERLETLLRDEQRPLQIVFAGKAHPRDDGGKGLIQRIARLQEVEPFRNRLIFIENYDIHVARRLIQGVDLWLNTPQRPEEACGTSGMKAVLNGVLNCSILDGWWAEAFDGRNGFGIRSAGPHADPEIQRKRDAEALYAVLEEEVIPCFFERDDEGIPSGWIDRMKWAFTTLAWRYSADRMVMDYATHGYLPAAGGRSASFS